MNGYIYVAWPRFPPYALVGWLGTLAQCLSDKAVGSIPVYMLAKARSGTHSVLHQLECTGTQESHAESYG